MCSNFKVATENESNCDAASHVWINECIKYCNMPYAFSSWFVTFLSAQPLEQMREKVTIFTWAAVLTPVVSDHVHYKTAMSGGRADLITAIKCGTAGVGLWTCVFLFLFCCCSDSFWLTGKCQLESWGAFMKCVHAMMEEALRAADVRSESVNKNKRCYWVTVSRADFKQIQGGHSHDIHSFTRQRDAAMGETRCVFKAPKGEMMSLHGLPKNLRIWEQNFQRNRFTVFSFPEHCFKNKV